MSTRVRRAAAEDLERLRPLLAQLGYPAQEAAVAARLAALLHSDRDAVLVAEPREGAPGPLLGLISLHWGEMLHLAGPVARIGSLVVEREARGRGVGALLLREAEALARRRACTLIEVTAGRDRHATHAFYAAQGFAWSSLRLRKVLD
jgi:GNAT superfamily N-acetyltransferase